jgi:CSLREA domain-containing protein/uncharacterized repeat protein (TIGR01451 family)
MAVITVDTTDDEDDTNPANCSLREAIVAANTDAAFGGCIAGSGDDVITFTVSGTITLTTQLPDISTSVMISGPGASQLTLSGDNNVRVFQVAVANPGTVTLSGVTVADALVSGNGGAILNASTGTLNVSYTTLDNNWAGFGAGVYNSSTGTVNITNSILSNNSTSGSGFGGGIFNSSSSGTINVINSTLSNNSAPNGGGGGIANNGSGSVSVTNSTLSGNSAGGSGFGGGIYNNNAGPVSVTNSTLSGNSAGSVGGGISNQSTGQVTVTNSTLSDNSAGTFGGAIASNGTVPVQISNSIIAGNSAPGAGPNLNGSFTTQGYNLIGDNGSVTSSFPAGNPNANGDIVGTNAAPLDPLLGPLANNGGPTQTHRLLTTSPALDKGKNFAVDENNNSIATDQRGLLRPVDLDDSFYPNASGGDASDIGAYELQGDTVQTGTPELIVNTPDDHDDGDCTDGDCTLREAIIAANFDSDLSTIIFDLPGAGPHTIQLTSFLDDLETDMHIEGPSDESVSVKGESGFNPYSIFTIAPGAVVSISNLTITDGAEFAGGGILNCGSLVVNNTTFTNNLAVFGGAISNCGSLTVNRSTFTGNQAEFAGAIDNIGTANIKDSTFTDNLAFVGGGIYNENILNIENSTFTGNHSFEEGGAIDTEDGFLIMVNSTISGNTSDGAGGGLLHCGFTTGFLTNVTITNNRADADGYDESEGFEVGGGISQISDFPITLRNTIVAGNFRGESPSATADDIDGLMAPESSFNLIGTGGSGGLVDRSLDPAHGNQVGVANPGLGPLQDNGGPTFTHALLPGSQAFNAAIDMTSLVGSIDDSQTTIDVADAGGIPNCIGFTIRIDDEQLIVNCKFGNTLTVIRGANGTTPAPHPDGASVNPPFDQRGVGFNRVVFTNSDTSLDVGAFEVQEAAPHHLAFNVHPSNTIAGATISPAVTVVILDAENNSTTSNADVTLAIGTNPGGGILSGTTTVAAVNGTATFSNLSIDKIGTGYTLTAASPGLTGATSGFFNITSPASVTGTKTVSGVFNPGSTVTYTVVLSNGGPAGQLDNPGDEFIDVLPSTLTLVSASATSGTAASVIATNTVTWNGSIANGGSVTITITATINMGTAGQTISNQGTINYDADGNGTNEANRLTDDPSVGGENDPTSFTVNSPDLTITKTHSGNFTPGQTATYTITVTNSGSGSTDGNPVTVTDVVPTGLTPTAPNGPHNGWECSINGQTLTCTRSDVLASGSSYPTITLTVQVANPAPLTVTNRAVVAGGGEGDTTNNTATDVTNINCTADPALTNNNPLVISRFRMNGPRRATDEFIEIFNPTDETYTVATGNCTGGLAVFSSAGNGTTSNAVEVVCQIPNGTHIPARGYFLCTGATYSLGNLGRNGGVAGATATGDAPIGCGGACRSDIPDDAGLALLDVGQNIVTLCPKGSFACATGFTFSSSAGSGDAKVYDSVGFLPYGQGAPAPGYPSLASTFCEGNCLKPVGDASIDATCAENSIFPTLAEPPLCYGQAGQYEFLRRQTTFDSLVGTLHQDTNNNVNDILLVTPNAGTNMGVTITGVSGVTGIHGAAGPQNSSAPADFPRVKFTQAPFDGPGTNQLGPRNAERNYPLDPTVANPDNDPLGTFALRLRFTNNSGSIITGLRFRVDNVSTLCGPQSAGAIGTGDAKNLSSTPDCGAGGFTAILKLLNSVQEVVVDGSETLQAVHGTVIEDLSATATPTPPDTPPNFLSPFGGGLDNSFVVNPSSSNSSVGDGVTGGTGVFSTIIGDASVLRIKVKFGVVRSGRFILLITPAAKTAP